MNTTTTFCSRCGEAQPFLSHLHGDKGGPLMCIPCRLAWDKTYIEDLKQCPDWKKDLHGVTGACGGEQHITYLTAELLVEALSLTHSDRHPPERREQAQRVTIELLALKPYAPP